MPNKATGKPFDSTTGRAASLKSPWRKQQFCDTERAKTYRRRFDQDGKSND